MRLVHNICVGMFCALLIPGLAWAQTAVQNSSCVTCHADMFGDMKASVHTQHEVLCQNCHGGDPTKADKEAAHDPAAGYIGVPDKKQLVKVCGECHADVERMNPYGIPTDQMARYKTSVHGKQLFEQGNARVAACTDCHGYHDVVMVTDPQSPVYPSNVPKTCNQCHGDEKLMSKFNIPSDIFKKYEGSVHGKALFEKKDISVAQCVSCHGSHGAVPPGVKDVANVCGKCHLNEQKYFAQSPHASILDKDKFGGCISCHSNHGIVPVSVALYGKACVQCHDVNSKEFQVGRQLATMIGDAQNKLAEAGDVVKQAGIEGIFVEEETAALEQAKTHVVEMGPLQHTLSVDKINDNYKKLSEAVEEVKAKIKNKRNNVLERKIFLIPIWLFIFIMSYAFWTKYKFLKAHKSKGETRE